MAGTKEARRLHARHLRGEGSVAVSGKKGTKRDDWYLDPTSMWSHGRLAIVGAWVKVRDA